MTEQPTPAGMIPAADHIAWCRRRATEYVEAGQLQEAVAGLLSDLQKHPATLHHKIPTVAMQGFVAAQEGPAEVLAWLDRIFA